MRQLLPEPLEDVDPLDVHRSIRRSAPSDRPWVLSDFVAAVDGSITLDGRSGGLSSPADRLVFRALRAVSDAVVVGASTARAEGYGPALPSPEVQALRRADGRPPAPRIVIVTRSMQLDWEAPLFTETLEGARTVVLTTAGHDEATRRRASEVADLLEVGTSDVALADGLAALAGLGVGVALCEGGPTLFGQLVAAGLVDELCLTRAPVLASSHDPGLLGGVGLPNGPQALELTHLLEDGGNLFGRWLLTR